MEINTGGAHYSRNMPVYQSQWAVKLRNGPHGVHLFDRDTGINVLLDEIRPDRTAWSKAPRQVSIALLNLCDLHCSYCYAPKHKASLTPAQILAWLRELDQAGCLGVGFGGGEPTLHPQFADICQQAAANTQMAITFTTHGHRLSQDLLDQLQGAVHFVRVSVDGVDGTYERLRGRKFTTLRENLDRLAARMRLGINVVVNRYTVAELDQLAAMAADVGARELLLLPQQPTAAAAGLDVISSRQLQDWVSSYGGPVRLAVSEAGADGLPTCDPLPDERGLQAYAHIDATGQLRASSYGDAAVAIEHTGVIHALAQLRTISTIQRETTT